MSYDIVRNIRPVKLADGNWTYRGSFAASNVTPQYFESHTSSERWETREACDTAIAWHFWDGSLQGGKSEYAVRDDIARILSKRAKVRHLSSDEWDRHRDTHRYGSPIAVMENTIFPAARDLYAVWKGAKGKYTLVDDDGGFIRKIVTRRHSGTTIHRSSKPIFWKATHVGNLMAKIALESFNLEYRLVSEADVSNAEQAIIAEREDDHIPSYILARRLFDNAAPLFEKEFEWCANRFPALRNNGKPVKQVAA